MGTLIEDTYCSNSIDLKDIYKVKEKDLSYFEKYILGIENFHGYQDNSIFDVVFMSRVPMQMVACRYKFLRSH